MARLVLGGDGGSGGGGLHFRDPADEFTGNNLNACRNARDTYFNLAANADAKAQFAGDRSLAIILNPTNSSDNVFQTYLGSATDTSVDSLWVNRTDAIEGNAGDDGRQGAFDLECYINESALPVPATPTGGSYVVATGVYTPPTGTTDAPTVPGAGEDIYRSQARINPLTDTGTVVPTWSPWVERAHLSPGITHVESDDTLDGAGTAGSPIGVRSPIVDMGAATAQVADVFTFDPPDGYTAGGWPVAGTLVQFSVGEIENPDDTDVVVRIGTDDYALTTFGGREVRLHELIDDTQYIALGKSQSLVLMGPADAAGQIVDITESSLPAPDEDAFGRIYLDRRTPAAYIIHETSSSGTPVQGRFDTYSNNPFYLGYGASDADYPQSGQADISEFYWNTADQQFREWRAVLVSNGPPVYTYEYQTVHDPRIILGGNTGVWLGHTGGVAGLRGKLPQDGINTTRRYIGVTTNSTGTHVPIVQEFDNSTYVAAVNPVFSYDFVTVGLYGQGGTGGLTAAQVQVLIDAGLSNLIDGAPAGRNTLNEINTALAAVESSRQRHWYLTGGTRNGRSIEYPAPTGWVGLANIADGDAITFDVPTAWISNAANALAIKIGTDALRDTNGVGGSPFPAMDVRAGSRYRAVWAGTRWAILDSGISAAVLKDFYEGNSDTNAFTDALLTKLNGIMANAAPADGVADAVSLEIAGQQLTVRISRTIGADLVDTETIPSGGGGGGGSDDGVITSLAMSNAGLVTVGRSVGADFTADFASAIRALIAAVGYVRSDGATFTGPVLGITPTLAAHLTRKDYVDDLISGLDMRIAVLEGGSSGNHTRYFGWDANTIVSTADFTGAETSTTDEGVLPARTQQEGNAYIFFAVPEGQGVPTEVYLSTNPTNQISLFTRQAGLVNDSNGDPHIVVRSNFLQTYQYGGEAITIGHG